jgi:hypothetical protein
MTSYQLHRYSATAEMTMLSELGKTGKELIVVVYQILSWNSLGRTEEKHKYFVRIIGASVEIVTVNLFNMHFGGF